jgi:hypothetical protein
VGFGWSPLSCTNRSGEINPYDRASVSVWLARHHPVPDIFSFLVGCSFTVMIFPKLRRSIQQQSGRTSRGMISLAIKLLYGDRICPAVFVIGNKSVNRSKKRSRSWYVVVADMP